MPLLLINRFNFEEICVSHSYMVHHLYEGMDRGGAESGIEGAESGVEGAESGVEGVGSGSRGAGRGAIVGEALEKMEGKLLF